MCIHKTARTLCQGQGIHFESFLQPLLFWGEKTLTKNEKEWENSGFSSGDKKKFTTFKLELNQTISNSSEIISSDQVLHDLTNCFDLYEEELYIDSGHLNRYGNLIVSEKISDLIFERNPSLWSH